MRYAGDSEGLTLLEIVIAVFLIAAAVAVSIPALTRGRASLNLHTAGRDVIAVMRYAREKAVTGMEEVRVVLEREKGTISLVSETGEGDRSTSLPRHVSFERFTFGREEVRQGPLLIRFLANGSAESAEILLRADNGAALIIVTDSITGVARAWRPGEERTR